MAMADDVVVLKQCVVTPPPGVAADISFPLTFFDIYLQVLAPMQRLVFYQLPISRAQFINNIIPQLQNSLAYTLKYFLPLAGKLIEFSNSNLPEIRYKQGDGVPFIVAEFSASDFNYLIANYTRNNRDFHQFVPTLEATANDTYNKIVPVLAIQVTLFPGTGICIGITNDHTVGDGSSMFSFMKAWALSSKIGETAESNLNHYALPSLDRSMVNDPKGIASIFFNQLRSFNPHIQNPNPVTFKLRATFFLDPEHIKKLKNLVQTKRPTVKRTSSFTVTCAYLWTCLIKSLAACGEVLDDEELEHFVFLAESRERLNPPLPANYFGNCVVPCYVNVKNGEIMGKEGIINAAEKIAEVLHQKLNYEDEILEDAETWISTPLGFNLKRVMSVAGSPRFNYYDLEFGWGKPIKFEFVSIDSTEAFSLSSCRDSQGGMEIGVSFHKPKLEAFASFFNEGLKALC